MCVAALNNYLSVRRTMFVKLEGMESVVFSNMFVLRIILSILYSCAQKMGQYFFCSTVERGNKFSICFCYAINPEN